MTDPRWITEGQRLVCDECGEEHDNDCIVLDDPDRMHDEMNEL